MTEAAVETGAFTRTVTATVNGTARSADVETRLLLVHFLRETLGAHRHAHRLRHDELRRVHGAPGRDAGEVVHVFAVQADGREITTVEGLAGADGLSAVQEGFHEEHGLQCGFCTPGMMLTATALLAENPDPSEEEIRWAISGQICRCTGYQNIVKAVQYAAAKGKEG